MSSARAQAILEARRCLCGCGQVVSTPRRKDGYRVSRKWVPVRHYASRACAAKMARAAKVRAA